MESRSTEQQGLHSAVAHKGHASHGRALGKYEHGPDYVEKQGPIKRLKARMLAVFAPLARRVQPLRAAIDPYYQKWLGIWRRRWSFSYVVYVLVFLAVLLVAGLGLQWSVYTDPQYAPGDQVDDALKASQSALGQLTTFVSNMWLRGQYQFLLNCLVLGLIYLFLVFLINRFWVATGVFGALMLIYTIANKVKMVTRNVPIIPTDLNFLAGGNTGNILSFIPPEQMPLVNGVVAALVVFVLICVLLQIIDLRQGLLPVRWKHLAGDWKAIAGSATRIVAAVLSFVLLFTFTWNLSNENSGVSKWAASLGDKREMWDGLGDARMNGTAVNFLRLVHTHAMDRPDDYSASTMSRLAQRYDQQAEQINQTRTANLTDNTVIMVLSESYSDPLRVPGVSFAEDPMPNIRGIEAGTTSGLMFSTGYGGGTANMEYQALTGMSMANFDPSLSVAYQQLVPKQKWTPTFNQAWNAAHGDRSSQAVHSYMSNMYFRSTNYRKFKFSKFWTVDGPDKIEHCAPLPGAPYDADSCTYANALDHLNADPQSSAQFMQVVTMQNHLPYNDWYQDNQFKAADTSPNLSGDERTQVDTYAKGMNYTDQATADFLGQLDQISKPITVIFYGDHLPGIYSTASQDPANAIALHQTDYFIWSNTASQGHGQKLPDIDSQFTSPNYFMAQTAEHLNARVSPYLAFLTEMHQEIPAMSIPSAAGPGNDPAYLDVNGQRIDVKALSKQVKSMLHDYQLIQYDVSLGKNYLKNTDFMMMPQ